MGESRGREAFGQEPFVGRVRELEVMRRRFAGALGGRGGCVLLAGEPGIGKTRLAEELAAEAAAAGARPLWGRCYEGEGAPAFWPWVQILSAYMHQQEPEALPAILADAAPDIAQLLPELRERIGDVTPSPPIEVEQARFRLFRSVTSVLQRAAQTLPLILILDDLHWADAPSLLLIEFIVRSLGESRLLLVGTYRDIEVRRGRPLAQTLGDLMRRPEVERVVLAGLSVPEIAHFIQASTGEQPPAPLVEAVATETEGNPFFVSEVLRLLAAEGGLAQATTSETLPALRLPETVREVVGRRLDRLSEESDRALSLAAVVGRNFGLNVLRLLSKMEDEALLEALEGAEAARLIEAVEPASGQYRFTHALIRETLYTDLPATRRLVLHRQAGEALEAAYASDLDAHLSELAFHFGEAAAVGAAAKAVAYGRRAAERAAAQLAYEEAARLYELALRSVPLLPSADASARVELLVGLADAQVKSGASGSARETLLAAADVARTLGSPSSLADIALRVSRVPAGLGQADAEVQHLLQEAARAVAGKDSGLRARLLARSAILLCWSGEWERLDALSREAVAAARESGDAASLIDALHARHVSLFWPAYSEERLAVAAEILRLAHKRGDEELELRTHNWLVLNQLEIGNVPAVDAELAAHASLAQASRQPRYLWHAAYLRTMRALLAGRFAEAPALAREAEALGVRAQRPTASVFSVLQLYLPYVEQGREQELERPLRELVERYPTYAILRCMLAALLSASRRDAEARAELVPLSANSFAAVRKDLLNWLVSATLIARVCASLGDADLAAGLYELLLPFSARSVTNSEALICLGSVSHYLGLLAATMQRWGDAERHFEAAIEMNRRMTAWSWLAHSRHEYAELLIARDAPGDRDRALDLLARAIESARELGMTRLLAQAEAAQQLQVAGRTAVEVGTQSAVLSPESSLTRREVEVLRLLAGGRTNGEIADALVVSVHTVERHLASAYAKIGVRSRLEAGAYALRHGLT